MRELSWWHQIGNRQTNDAVSDKNLCRVGFSPRASVVLGSRSDPLRLEMGEAPAEPLLRFDVSSGSRLSGSFALPNGADSIPKYAHSSLPIMALMHVPIPITRRTGG